MGQSLKSSAYLLAVISAVAIVIVLTINRFRFAFSLYSLGMAALLAAISIGCTVFGLRAMHLGSLSIYTLFLMLGGMLLPSVMGVAVLHEEMGLPRKLAFLLITVALALPVLDRKNRKKGSAVFYVLCFVLFLLNGSNSCVTKLHQINAQAVDSNSFLTMLYAVQMLTGLIYLLFSNTGRRKTLSLDWKSASYGIGYALVNSVACFANVSVAKTLPASLQYPLLTGGTILFSALCGWILFKEKPNAYTTVGIVLAVGATVLYAL